MGQVRVRSYFVGGPCAGRDIRIYVGRLRPEIHVQVLFPMSKFIAELETLEDPYPVKRHRYCLQRTSSLLLRGPDWEYRYDRV